MQESTLTPNQHRYYGKIVEDLNILKGRISSIFSNATEHKLTMDSIIERLNGEVTNQESYLKLPAKYKLILQGYTDAKFDSIWQELEWVHWYDGKFVGKGLDKFYSRKRFDQNKVEGFHVYKGTQIIYFKPIKD